MTPGKHCPHCAEAIPTRLVWKTLFAGQVAHACPACGKRFRLTYPAKIRIGYLNVLLLVSFIVLWNLPDIPRNLLVYAAIAAVVFWLLPRLARYEKTTAPYR